MLIPDEMEGSVKEQFIDLIFSLMGIEEGSFDSSIFILEKASLLRLIQTFFDTFASEALWRDLYHSHL